MNNILRATAASIALTATLGLLTTLTGSHTALLATLASAPLTMALATATAAAAAAQGPRGTKPTG